MIPRDIIRITATAMTTMTGAVTDDESQILLQPPDHAPHRAVSLDRNARGHLTEDGAHSLKTKTENHGLVRGLTRHLELMATTTAFARRRVGIPPGLNGAGHQVQMVSRMEMIVLPNWQPCSRMHPSLICRESGGLPTLPSEIGNNMSVRKHQERKCQVWWTRRLCQQLPQEGGRLDSESADGKNWCIESGGWRLMVD